MFLIRHSELFYTGGEPGQWSGERTKATLFFRREDAERLHTGLSETTIEPAGLRPTSAQLRREAERILIHAFEEGANTATSAARILNRLRTVHQTEATIALLGAMVHYHYDWPGGSKSVPLHADTLAAILTAVTKGFVR